MDAQDILESVAIMNGSGQHVMNLNSSNSSLQQQEIDIHQLPVGTYYVLIKSKETAAVIRMIKN
jgi:hypothetical protein